MVSLALYEPEIPHNTGALIRLCACWDVPLWVIEPCGFLWSDRHLRRASLDYREHARVIHSPTWEDFLTTFQHPAAPPQPGIPPGRLVLVDGQGGTTHTGFAFQQKDILLMGKESSGVSVSVRQRADHVVRIPMLSQRRSLNMALAASVVLAEALRQLDMFPKGEESLLKGFNSACPGLDRGTFT